MTTTDTISADRTTTAERGHGRGATPSYASGTSDLPLLGDTIGDLFDQTVALHGDHDALVDRVGGHRWTYAELNDEVVALAHGLLRAGIEKGDRVGIWAPNCAEWTVVQYATAKVGAILVNINPAYRTHELTYVLNHSGVRLLVATRTFRSSDYAAMIDEVRLSCPRLEQVALIGSCDWHDLHVRDVDPMPLAARQASLSPDDPINIQYTSGTTGHPKGATLSHHNIVNNAHLIGELSGYTDRDRICVPVPLYHTFGMVIGNLGALTHGASVVYPAPAFDPKATLAAIAEERCTSLYGVPTMFIAELGEADFDDYDLTSLRTGIMGGSPCPVEVMKQVIERMGMSGVTIVYGMTETSPVSTQTRADDPLHRRVGSVGRVHPHLEIKIVDPATGLTVPRGDTGELCTRGYSVMLGYWEQPDKTAEVVDSARWMHSGDLATMDAEGYISITGRLKDMLIRGGENISPREIEEFLHTHPAVRDVQIIGVPDARLGEEIMAWIQLQPGAADLTVDDIRAFAHGRLARYKIPRYVRVVTEFPMTVSGKVRKIEMRRISAEMLNLADESAAGSRTAG
jgi:fatty-acyl-CoA synthase